jgi:hypothetical protein
MKRVLLILTILIAIVGGLWCLWRPYLAVKYSEGKATVHLETLGEYPTTITHVQIADWVSGDVVLDLRAESGTPQLRNFSIFPGKNSVSAIEPQYGSYRTIRPNGSTSFFIQKGRKYRVTIWGKPLLPAHEALAITQ